VSKWFWIVFDTSQYMDYYKDVHNLLAQPSGSSLRYDYKLSLLSEDAIKRVKGNVKAPVLLVYTQKDGEYTRTERVSVAPQEELPCLYVSTRLATMLNVTQDGDSFYFDLHLQGYPAQGQALLNLMQELEKKGQTPWSKTVNGKPYGNYVCTSENIEQLQELEKGDEQKNWSAIVNRLSAPPMQFWADTFWRLKGPYPRQEGKLLVSSVETLTEKYKTRQAQAIYHIRENSSWRFELVSEIGVGTAPRDPIVVEATCSDDRVLKFTGNLKFPLRRYSATPVEFRSLTAELLGTSFSEIAFSTAPQPADWIIGAAFPLKFRLKRNFWRILLGVVTGLGGAAAYVVGDSKLLECLPALQIKLKVAGIVFAAISYFALTGKITFSGK
jgi:hypothetical protein